MRDASHPSGTSGGKGIWWFIQWINQRFNFINARVWDKSKLRKELGYFGKLGQIIWTHQANIVALANKRSRFQLWVADCRKGVETWASKPSLKGADCCICFRRYILNAQGCLFGSEHKQHSQCITFPAASSYIIDRQGLLPLAFRHSSWWDAVSCGCRVQWCGCQLLLGYFNKPPINCPLRPAWLIATPKCCLTFWLFLHQTGYPPCRTRMQYAE